MKKTNVFVFESCFLIIISGFASLKLWGGIYESFRTFVPMCREAGFFASADAFTSAAEKTCTEGIGGHDVYMDINSLFLRYTNTKIVEKEDISVVKSETDYLANPRPYMEDEKLKSRAEKVAELCNVATENGAEFMYITAPTKGYEMKYSANVEDFTKSNCDRFSLFLAEKKIPHLNLIEVMKQRGVSEEEMFFVTDHHWKPNYAFMAAGEISATLCDKYGFNYDKENMNIENYNVKTLKNWFLGSQGKKVGSFFTPLGPDDIDIITPKFETSLTEEQPNKGAVREGRFEDTVMYMENASARDLYTLNPYATYSGGDFREQIITNHLNPDGASVLLIRDSFSCAMSPFLALNASKLYCVDVRAGGMYVGDKIRVYEYIERIKPDYVLVMYTGVSSGDDLFDFN